MNPALSLRHVALCAAVATMALSACSADTSTSKTAAAAAAAAAAASTASPQSTASPLCSRGVPTDDATTGRKVMRSRGTGWTYDQDVPATYDGTTPVHLVIALGTADATERARSTSGADTVVLSVTEPIDGSGWRDAPEQVRFVKDLVLRAETQLCFDERHIYVVGEGDGELAARAAARDLPETVQPLDS